MPHVVITRGALNGLERCRLFLATKNKSAANRAGQAIQQKLDALKNDPNVGRPYAELEDLPTLRELIIEFGDSGYVALYRFNPTEDAVYVLAFRHQKEAGY